jgi:hypothetical protein
MGECLAKLIESRVLLEKRRIAGEDGRERVADDRRRIGADRGGVLVRHDRYWTTKS